jgi:hypothetical protein
MYLLDSITKNHLIPYSTLFELNIVPTFAHVFGALQDAKSRSALYKLRQTWNSVFSAIKLHQLDLKISQDFDLKWPVVNSPKIHINPAVFNRQQARPSMVRIDMSLLLKI